jgi:hypothetical protein
MCGVAPIYGCFLCKKYGDGKGKILTEYRHQKVKVLNYEGIEVEMDPPTYECTTCKDTLQATYRIWVEKLRDKMISDNGWGKMPRVQLPCDKCKNEEHTEQKKQKEIELNQ